MAQNQHGTPISTEDIAAKVEWEGGITEVFQHGAFNESIFEDEELAEKWGEAQKIFEQLNPILEDIEKKLEESQFASRRT